VGQPARTLLQTRFPQPLERIEATLRRDGHWEGELDQTRRDGRAITMASRWALQRDGKGQSAAILEVSTDITARKALERALRGRDAIAETAQRITLLGTFHWDVATDTVHWSDEMFRLLGQDPEQVTPSFASFLDAVHPEDRGLIRAFMEGAYAGRTAPVEFRTVGPRDVVRTLHVQSEVLRDAAGAGILNLRHRAGHRGGHGPPARAAERRHPRGRPRSPLLHQWITEPERTAPPVAEPLTPREREVLQLLAQGLSNRQIGHACRLSVTTVKRHVEHILAKLGATDRTQGGGARDRARPGACGALLTVGQPPCCAGLAAVGGGAPHQRCSQHDAGMFRRARQGQQIWVKGQVTN